MFGTKIMFGMTFLRFMFGIMHQKDLMICAEHNLEVEYFGAEHTSGGDVDPW